jgi:uncharacterized RDD family membrane protein YckC
LAGFWIRFGGALIDGILLGIVNQIVGAATNSSIASIIALVISAGYFIYFHSSGGQSLGQKAVKVKVIDQANGGLLDTTRAGTRWLVANIASFGFLLVILLGGFGVVLGLIIAFASLLGYLWMLWDPNKQTWHDKVAKSVVVKLM